MSLGFERDCNRRQVKKSNRAVDTLPVNIRMKFHLRNFSKVVLGCVERQENATYSLRHKLNFTEILLMMQLMKLLLLLKPNFFIKDDN